MNVTLIPGNYTGDIHIPASKSDTQRALLIAALGTEESVLFNVGESQDDLAMLQTVELIGATIQQLNNRSYAIRGAFDASYFSEIACGESGLGLRLLTAIATLKSNAIELNGQGSLLLRDQSFFSKYLPQMGVEIYANRGKLPINITGPLKAGTYIVDGSESSQYISGLLIAFSQIEGETLLQVENLNSRPYVDMTLHTLQSFGIAIHETQQNVFSIRGKQSVRGTHYTIDGDWSAASFWLVASALGLNIGVKGLSMASKQADKAILNAFLNADCRILNGETIKIDGSNRKPLHFDATHCPDLFPALATYAALTEGRSILKGVHRLANKESNRGLALQEEFLKMGVQIQLLDDEMHIFGSSTIQESTVKSHHDHRIAMCLAIAAIVTRKKITIENADAVSKSYPMFWQDLKNLQH